jgi:hypothetical protein
LSKHHIYFQPQDLLRDRLLSNNSNSAKINNY